MSRPKEYAHIMFLTLWIVFVGILGFKSLTNHYERPCKIFSYKTYCVGGLGCSASIRLLARPYLLLT